MAKTDQHYPSYWVDGTGRMRVFMAPDKMYFISNQGTNTGNQGVAIDHYVTRNMVLKHWPARGEEVSWQQFRERYQKLFHNLLYHMSP